jgi:hypothetical protein
LAEGAAPLPHPGPSVLTSRTPDVTYNDLADPMMGSVDTRFGRLVPLARAMPEQKSSSLDPSPRIVSRTLLTRDYFKPVKTLNVIAAAWIQFMVHGWFNHKRHRPGDKDVEIPLEGGDTWPLPRMALPATVEASPANESARRPPTYINTETSWWDASQIYGSRLSITKTLRSWKDGKLNIGSNGLLPLDPGAPGIDQTGFNDNWWVGLSLLHTLFVKEHNAICDALKREYPVMSDDQLFEKARLVNSALIGKIHTIE